MQFVMDAFGHLKAIGDDAGAKPLLDKAGRRAGRRRGAATTSSPSVAPTRHWDREPKVRTLA